MGGTQSSRHSHGPLSDADAAVLSKFPKLERELLSRMFEDLAHHSTGCKTPAIDRNCFLRVFKGQPGMLGERLFAVFDQNSDGFVDHREFLEGLAIVVHGSREEKLNFLFKIYDLNGDGHVNYAELSTMLNCAASGAHILKLQSEVESEDEDHPHSHKRRSSASTVDEDAVSAHVDDLLESAFPGCTEMMGECRERLAPKEFFDFVDRNPEILEILELSFSLHDHSSDSESELDDVTGRARTADVYHEEEKKGGLKKSTSLTGISKRISFDGISKKLSVDVNEKKPRRYFVDTMLTPDALKERMHRQHERPVAFKCGDCDFAFDLNYCYSCGIETNVNDCKNCGKLFKIPFRFCPSCGNKLSPVSASPMMYSDNVENSQCSEDGVGGRLSRQSSLNGSVGSLNRGDSELKITAPTSESKEQKTGSQTPLRDFHSVPSSPMHAPAAHTANGSQTPTVASHTGHGRHVSLANSLDPHRHHHGHHVHASMHGSLFKVGKRLQEYGFNHLIERYYVLRDSFLYTFRRFTDPLARHIMWLEGCVVKPVYQEDKKMKWGFEISFPADETNENQKTFYAANKDIRDKWIVAVRDASHSQDINAYYTFEDQIGVGKFSAVKVCTHRKSQKKYAVKILDRRQMGAREREALRTEIAVMKLVHHPSIIQIRNVYETKDTIYLVMNLVRGGDLFDRIRTRRHLPEPSVRNIVWKLLDVVHYLHQRGVVHRDLKPENIMLEDMDHDDHILVGDFGLSKFSIPEGHMNLPCGTLAYVAPEVLKGVGYGKEVDLWSIGIIMYVCLRGALPFDSGNQKEIITLTLAGRLRFDDNIWKTVSHEAKDLIRGLLKIDPRQRLTCESAMQHPWFENYAHLSDDEHGNARRTLRSHSRRGSSSNLNGGSSEKQRVAQSAPGSAHESPRIGSPAADAKSSSSKADRPHTASGGGLSASSSSSKKAAHLRAVSLQPHANTLPPPGSSSSHHHSSGKTHHKSVSTASGDRHHSSRGSDRHHHDRHHSSSHRSSHHRSSTNYKQSVHKRRSVPSLTGTSATATSGGGGDRSEQRPITRSQTMTTADSSAASSSHGDRDRDRDPHHRPTRSTSHQGHSSSSRQHRSRSRDGDRDRDHHHRSGSSLRKRDRDHHRHESSSKGGDRDHDHHHRSGSRLSDRDRSDKDRSSHHRSSRDRHHGRSASSRSLKSAGRSASQPRSSHHASDEATATTHTSSSRDRQVLNTHSTTTTVDSAHSPRKSKTQHLTTQLSSDHTSSSSNSTRPKSPKAPTPEDTQKEQEEEKEKQKDHEQHNKDKEPPVSSPSHPQKVEPPETKAPTGKDAASAKEAPTGEDAAAATPAADAKDADDSAAAAAAAKDEPSESGGKKDPALGSKTASSSSLSEKRRTSTPISQEHAKQLEKKKMEEARSAEAPS